METQLGRPLEAALIEERRLNAIPPMSPEQAAKQVGASGKRWRELEKGFDSAGRPTRARPALLAKMAELLGMTAEDLDAVGRSDAARIVRGMRQQEQDRQAAEPEDTGEVVSAVEEAIRRALREIEDNRILTDREKAELAATFMEMIQSDVAVRRQQFATILRATMRASGTGQ